MPTRRSFAQAIGAAIVLGPVAVTAIPAQAAPKSVQGIQRCRGSFTLGDQRFTFRLHGEPLGPITLTFTCGHERVSTKPRTVSIAGWRIETKVSNHYPVFHAYSETDNSFFSIDPMRVRTSHVLDG